MSSAKFASHLEPNNDLSSVVTSLLSECVTSLPQLDLSAVYLVTFAEHYAASAIQFDDSQFKTRFKIISLEQQWRFLNTWLRVGKLLLSLELDPSASMKLQVEVGQAVAYVAEAQPSWLDDVKANMSKQEEQPVELHASLLDEGLKHLKSVNSIVLKHCES